MFYDNDGGWFGSPYNASLNLINKHNENHEHQIGTEVFYRGGSCI